jgi:phage-related protein
VAEHRIGSVHGEIIIDYDENGVMRARGNINTFKEELRDLDDGLRKNADEHDRMGKTATRSANQSREALQKVGSSLLSLLTSFGKMAGVLGLVGSALPAVVALGSALTTASGAALILPGAFAAMGVAMAAFKVALSGVSDALEVMVDLEADAAAVEEALKKLSPAAREFALAVRESAKAFKPVQQAVQEAFFNGLGPALQRLTETYIPVLRDGLVGVAEAVNIVARRFAIVMTEGRNVEAVNGLFRATRLIVFNLGNALGPLAAAFLDLANAGAEVFARLTGGAFEAANAFREWTASFIESGRLEEVLLGGLNALRQLGGLLVDIAAIVGNVFGPLVTGSETAAGGLGSVLDRLREFTATEEFATFMANLGRALIAVGDAIGTLITGGLDALGPYLPIIVSAVAALAAALADNLVPVIEFLAPIIAGLALYITANADAISQLLIVGAILVGVLKAVAVAQAALNLVMLMNPYVAIAAAVIALVAIIIMNWDKIVEFLSATWEWIASTSATIWNGIVDFFTGLWDGIVLYFSSVWSSITDTITSVWNSIVTFFTDVFTRVSNAIMVPVTAIRDFLNTVWSNIVSAATTVLTPIITIITGIFTIIHTVISTVVELIWILIQSWFQQTVELFHAIWDPLAEWFTGIWNYLYETISTIISNTVNFVSEKWNQLVTIFHAVFDPLAEWFSALWADLQRVASAAVEMVTGAVSNAWNRVSQIFHSVFDPIISWFRGVWDSVSGSVRDGVNNVMNLVGSLPGRIIGALGDAANWLVSAGKNVIIGLINGIASMVTEAVRRVKDAASAVINGAKSALGIASPSTVFRAFGEYTMQGYVVGVDNLKDQVVNTVARVATNIVAAGQLDPMTMPASVLARNVGVSSTSAGVSNTSTNTRTTNIENLTLKVDGNLDPTNPVAFRQTIVNLKDAIRTLDEEYV